jgi:hypothetical protein
MRTVALMLCLIAPAALAGGKKSLSSGLTTEEIGRLEKSMKEMATRFQRTSAIVEHMRKNPDLKGHLALSGMVGDAIKQRAEVVTYFSKMNGYLQKKDPKVVSYEQKLQGEIEAFKYKLESLQVQAKKERVDSLSADLADAIAVTVATVALAVAFDSAWDLAVADVDLMMIPVIDVDHDVIVIEHDVLVEEVTDDAG